MPGNPTEAREHAANCFRIAETAASPTVQKTFFDLADQWNRLARDLEDALSLLAAVTALDSNPRSEVDLLTPDAGKQPEGPLRE
jgi:hypothetical protein